MPLWGRLANSGFEDHHLKAVYFFAGSWKSGADKFWADQAYEFPTARNDQTYTVFPEDNRHLFWSVSPVDPANRVFALEEILSAGTNVVVMSYWGARGSDRWASSAPMQTSTKAHDELFDAALNFPLVIMPAIESASGTVDGASHSYVFSDDFPGTPGNPAPALVEQLVDLIDRYLLHPRNPAWPAKWAQMFDSAGSPRHAVNILHVASRHLAADADAAFAAGFDAVANVVLQRTGIAIGFTLDILPSTHTFTIGDWQGWVPWFEPRSNVRVKPGTPITQTWANRDHLDLFTINDHGTVVSTWWDQAEPQGYRPEGWFPIHRETLFHPGSLVTAIRRTPGHVDLFATDKDGIVCTIWWDQDEPAGYRPEGWIEIHGEMRCPPGAPVAASWGNEDHLDIFVTDRFGAVQSTYWDDNEGGWRADGWFAIDSATVFHPGGAVTALHLGEDHLDLYAADQNGVVRSIWWDSNDGYRAEGWFEIGREMRTVPGAKVTALWADNKHLDLFVTGDNGVVRSTYWDSREPAGFRPLGWFDINGAVTSVGGAPVEALWSHDGTMLHLFMVDVAGRVVEAIWQHDDDPTKTWNAWPAIWPELKPVAELTPAIGPRLKTVAGGTVTASHPRGVHIDAFVASETSRVFSSWKDTLTDTYVGHPENLGPHLKQQLSMLAVQAFIPEIWLGGSNNRARFSEKYAYIYRWWLEGVPVLMDISPGYDAHKVFPDSSSYGYTDEWRGWFVALWSAAYSGVVYNTWNGYTEGYAGMRQQLSGDRDFAWLQRMFGLF
jgi:hypothetical protein